MTLALAAKHPFSIFKNCPGPKTEAILLCTDSRLTLQDGAKLDVCEKLFPLTENCALVCAGNAWNHLVSVQYVRDRLVSSAVYTVSDLLTTITECYRFVVSIGTGFHSEALIGMYDHEQHAARLFQLTSSPELEVKELEPGLYAIGSDPDRKQYYKFAFEDQLSRWLKTGSQITDSPLEWLQMMVVPLQSEFIKHGWDPYVGGLVQAATIDNLGFHWVFTATLEPRLPDMQVVRKVVRENNTWVCYDQNNNVVEATCTLDEVMKLID